MSVVYRQGFWTDVCVLPDGRFAQVATDGATERVFISGERDTELPAAEPLMFCRCACGAHDGVVYSIHQGHDTGSALLITHTGVQNLGPTFGVQPVAIDSQYAYVVRSNQAYDRIRLDNGAVEHLPHGAPGSSQGISDVVDGEIWWADLERLLTVAGVALTYPNELVGAVIVGQTDPPQIAGAFTSKRKWQPFTAIPGPAFEPHLAQSGERYAIVARTPQGAAYVEVPPYPALLTTSPPPIVNIPKPEEPKPVSITFPVSAKVVRDRYVASFSVPQKLTPGNADDAFENLCRAWVLGLAEQVRFETNDARWGVKNAGGGRAQSKDSLTWNGERLVNFDLLSGVGTGKPTLVKDPAGEDITGQTFMPVQPVDHLGLKQTVPSVPPTVPVDLAALRNEVAALSVKLAQLEAHERAAIANTDWAVGVIGERLRALEQKPAPKYRAVGSTSRVFGHSHAINVTLEPTE